ncbi:hypothetical protein DMH04_01530 [Kibdelosporangium aridum]|uniref:NB-ARC domain-containing protein n=1 Tax=Kibdelosporangium aridum TaxID=2030 RepID=A0A428ZUB6_KIBAR|nr:tetratricopeptide repeat protein [Kibdelosporangium aridum]RSM91684.1 hypothetical protein DMH04_01530 [Kibdelosporangium aridum]
MAHHTIVVLDIEGFGDRRRTNPHQRGVRDGLYDVVRTSFDAVGVPWADCYHEDRGDAVFILAPASASKAVFVEALPHRLITALRVHNDTHPEAQRMRLRMALHAGEVQYDDHGVASSSLNLAFRLIDGQPLKAALAASPGVLALITSDWFFEDVVRHTPGAAPATYRRVRVAEKETSTIAWITLPDHPYPAERRPVDRSLVPRQLPLAIRDFTGRADHVAALDDLIPADDEAPTVVITAIDGTAGIGKTTLAVHWAHRVQHRFPDGTLHVNLRGYGPGAPATPSQVLDGFLRALDVPAEKMPVGVDEQAALYRSLLDGRRMLIVLDNANSADQVRPLLPGAAGCMVIVTSRDSLTGLVVTEAAHRLSLDLLTPSEALNLVIGIIGADQADAEPEAVADLLRLCARLPLALRIAASKVAAQRHTTVAEVVAELADEHSRLDVLSNGGDERAAVRAVFDWSYQRLTTDQARLFRRLGLHPGPDLSLHAAAVVGEIEVPVARKLLENLTEAHLIEPTARERYRFHDLLRAYAADQAHRRDLEDDRDRAIRNLFAWYAQTAYVCDQLLHPNHYRIPLQLPPVARAYEAQVHNFGHALVWLEDEYMNLLAVLHNARQQKLYQHVLHLADGMRFLYLLGSWDDYLDTETLGLVASGHCRDGRAERHFLGRRGETLTRLHRWDEARADFDRVLAMARAAADSIGEGVALSDLGFLYLERRDYDKALTYALEALPLVQNKPPVLYEAVSQGYISHAFVGLGHYRQALEHGERALALRRQIGDSWGESQAMHRLALAWQGLGDHQKTIDLCRKALTLGRATRDEYTVAVGRTTRAVAETIAALLDTLAISLHHTGNTAEAIACWHEAVAVLEESGYEHRAAEVRQRLHNAIQADGPLRGP